jgi:LmbE family N-acetylglucosaminyl deacetylase
MKRVLVGIFAHPDDEAFGPSGTLMKLADEGYDLHLVLLTDGEAGVNPNKLPDLAKTRLEEWTRAAELLGAQTKTALHFPDGGLKENRDEEIFKRLKDCLETILSGYDDPVELSFMTFEPNGLTDHIDHKAACRLATRLFDAVKAGQFTDVTPGKLWYFCLSLEQAPITEKTVMYVPRGREESYITAEVRVSEYLVRKYNVMNVHETQRADAEAAKKLGDRLLSTEYFHVES